MKQDYKLKGLKDLMQQNKDTQASLAKVLGMHRITFNYKLNERNGGAFTVEEMEAIADYYKVPANQRAELFFKKNW